MNRKTNDVLDDISMSIAGLIAIMDILEKNNGQNLGEDTLANFSWHITQELIHMKTTVDQINR